MLAVCNEATIPVTAAAGRSGVCGSSVPLYGGVVLDLCDVKGIRSVDDASLLVDVLPGTFGDYFEHELRTVHGLTCGHWPQSMALSTVGGWLACRGAGQLSTRYGKIEDMVVGLDVALADGTVIHTEGNARQATGPDLNQLFVGSEGTLGIITGARLRVHPAPSHERRAAYGFASFEDGLDACRRILRRGATPAVLRLYDAVEADRSYQTGDLHVLLVLDEGDPGLVDATIEVVEEECAVSLPLDVGAGRAVDGPSQQRGPARALIGGGLVVDTMEITGAWSALPGIYRSAVEAIKGRARHLGGLGSPVPRLSRRRLPVLHLRGQARRGRQGRLLPRRLGRRHPGRPRRWGCPQPPPRGGHQPGPIHGRGAGRRPRHAGRDQGRARPEGHPEPGQARAAQPVRTRPVRRARLADRAVSEPGPGRRAGLDLAAVGRGALAGAVIVIPAGVAQTFTADDSSLRGLLLVAILVGLGWAGAVAGRATEAEPLKHGALAAAVTYLVVQGAGSLVRVARGETVHPLTIVFMALLSACCGLLGAELGRRRRLRLSAPTEAGGGNDDDRDG